MPRPSDVDLSLHSDEEEALIQHGIAQDPDAPELTDVQLAAMRPAAEVVPELVRRRGPQKAPTKVPVALRLDADVVEALRASGDGWQTRANVLLRTVLGLDELNRSRSGAGSRAVNLPKVV